jgi:predicted nucleic acid-binding protein
VRFVDTDVLLYAVSRDAEERHKAELAIGLSMDETYRREVPVRDIVAPSGGAA